MDEEDVEARLDREAFARARERCKELKLQIAVDERKLRDQKFELAALTSELAAARGGSA